MSKSLKQRIQTLLTIFLLILSATAYSTTAGPGKSVLANEVFAASITSFSPASGAPGTLITVKGSGFTSASTLAVGGKEAIVVSFTATQIVGMVMPGATTGKLVVDGVSSATDFTVTATPYPSYQQGPKLIDTIKRDFGLYGQIVAPGQGKSVVLSADGNTAIVNGSDGLYPNYLFYARKDGIWKVSAAFRDGYSDPVFGNNLALSADGNTALIGQNFFASLPAKLYRRKNGVWAAAGTLSDSVGSAVALSADGKTAILGKRQHGGSYSGGEMPMGITIMKLVGSTWQPQQVEDVPYTFEIRPRYIRPSDLVYDEDGNVLNEITYYTPGTGAPGNYVSISADGKTASSTSLGRGGRYQAITLGYTVIYGLTAAGWKVQLKLPDIGYVRFTADGNTFVFGNTVYTRSGTTWSKQRDLPSGGVISADGSTVFVKGQSSDPPAGVDGNYNYDMALSADGTTAFVGVPDDATRTVNSAPLGSVTVYGVEPYIALDHATTISFSNTTATSTTLSWPRGNGITTRAVFLKMGTAGVPAATNGTSYIPDSLFMSFNSYPKGSTAATGWYCVYNGTGGYVNIKGLKTGTTYTASVVEYTGNAGAETYQVTGVVTRVTTPIVPPNYYTYMRAVPGKKPATMMDLDYFPFGPMPVGVTIFVKEMQPVFAMQNIGIYPPFNPETPLPGSASYTPSKQFGAGQQIGNSGWFCVYNGPYSPDGVNTLTVTGLGAGKFYRIVGVNYNGTKANPVYTEPDYMFDVGATYRANYFNPPTEQATNLSFTNTTTTGTSISWTKGNGESRAVFIARKANGYPIVEDGFSYLANTQFAEGQQVDTTGWYCIYNGSGTSTTVTGLLQATTYRVAVIEYNTVNYLNMYLTSKSSPANVTTVTAGAVTPTVAATALKFTNTTATTTTANWTNGNGTSRAVFIGLKTSGYPLPADATTYAANSQFSSGTQVGATGWYCIYNGTGTTVNVTGLSSAQTYRVVVMEYNGTAGNQKYLTAPSAPANVTTIAPLIVLPTTAAFDLVYTNTTATTTTATWTKGNGSGRAVFIRKIGSGYPVPANNTTYTASTTFGAGSQAGTNFWYCVYNGTGTSVNITGLDAGSTYRAMVVEYNGAPGSEKYLVTPGNPKNFYTSATPAMFASTQGNMEILRPELNQPVAEEGKVVANNILSPNGDGHNDTWVVNNIQAYPNNTVRVIDAKGNIVFSKKGYNNDWNGSYRGAVLTEGTYYYTIDLGTNASSPLKGFFTVVSDR